MVVLVTGGSGQLGQSLQSIASKHPQFIFYFADSQECDITDIESLSQIFISKKPDFCINAAAYTAVDKAESEPDQARAINVDGARKLAAVCRDHQCTLIHISTDFVFDGNKRSPYLESDAVNPQSVYGMTKLEGEKAVAETLREHFIVRTSWLYSEFGNNFMKTMLRLASERDTLGVVNDQTGTPTYAVDLARALVSIMASEIKAYGTYHFSNEGQATWYQFASEIFRLNDVSITLNPIPTSAFPTPAKRPAYSVLDKTRIKDTFGLAIREWQEALASIK